MAAPNRLPAIAEARGQTVAEMIACEIKSQGNIKDAAKAIGVTTWTVRRWIKRHGRVDKTLTLNPEAQS